MKTFSKSEFQTIKYICSLTQDELGRSLSSVLRRAKYKPVVTKDYIYAEGTIPIALVAHMDTVFPHPPQEIFYDTSQNVVWSPQGLGADDRAGIYAILQIIKTGLRPHIIFTTDEEKGGKGSLVLSSQPCPFKDLRYIIQLDRQGNSDCVFYDCDNPAFTEYICNFGFVEAYGTFTDISNFCPDWKIAGVNLSVGYRDEHSRQEVLFVNGLNATIQRVIKMLSVQPDEIPYFEYIEAVYPTWQVKWGLGGIEKYGFFDHYDSSDWNSRGHQYECCSCHKLYQAEDLFPIIDYDKKEKKYCYNCTPEDTRWCMNCGEAFRSKKDTNICEFCRRELDAYNSRRKSSTGKSNQ